MLKHEQPLIWRAVQAVTAGFLSAGAGLAATPAVRAYATGHVLVRFRPEVATQAASASMAGPLPAMLATLHLPPGARFSEPAVARILREKRMAVAGSEQEGSGLDTFLYLDLPPGLSVVDCLRQLEHHPLLEYAEPDWIGVASATIPADPDFGLQWYHQNADRPTASIQTPLAWDITRGSSAIVVGVLDTGLEEDLPEFAGRTVVGYNFADDVDDTRDENGHGTRVAGVLAASADNGVLGAGVDWHCRLMPVKVLDRSGQGLYSWWAQGIDFAVANGCKVINLSAGGTEFDRTLQRAIADAIAQGAVFVTAAGNRGEAAIDFPGFLSPCITVGATGPDDRRGPFSNSGPQLDLVAPGVDMLTVNPDGGVSLQWGTSFSAPLVSGVCALLAAVRPNLTQADARIFLCAGADDAVGDAEDTPGFDPHYGWGRLNAFHSLLLATTQIDVVRETGNGIELSWSSPANAADKQPWQVEWNSSLDGEWTLLPNGTAFRYESNRTWWTDSASRAADHGVGRFYRLRLRTF